MPPRPRRIGLVTSVGSAAEADFLHELDQSGLAFDVVVVDSRVQGREADRAIARHALHARGRRAASRWSRSSAAAAPAPTWPRSTASCWPAPSPASRSRCSPASATRSTPASPTWWPTPRARRRPPVPRRAGRPGPCGSTSGSSTIWRDLAMRVESAARRPSDATCARREATAAHAGGHRHRRRAGRHLDERRRRLVRAAPRSVEAPQMRLGVARLPGWPPSIPPAPWPAGWSITRTADGTSSSATPPGCRRATCWSRPSLVGTTRSRLVGIDTTADQFALRPRGDDHER